MPLSQDIEVLVSLIDAALEESPEDLTHYWMCDMIERAILKIRHNRFEFISNIDTLSNLVNLHRVKRINQIQPKKLTPIASTISNKGINFRTPIRDMKSSIHPVVFHIGALIEIFMHNEDLRYLDRLRKFSRWGGAGHPFIYEELCWQWYRVNYLAEAWKMGGVRSYFLLYEGTHPLEAPKEASFEISPTLKKILSPPEPEGSINPGCLP